MEEAVDTLGETLSVFNRINKAFLFLKQHEIRNEIKYSKKVIKNQTFFVRLVSHVK
jgi:hypothetical protein